MRLCQDIIKKRMYLKTSQSDEQEPDYANFATIQETLQRVPVSTQYVTVHVHLCYLMYIYFYGYKCRLHVLLNSINQCGTVRVAIYVVITSVEVICVFLKHPWQILLILTICSTHNLVQEISMELWFIMLVFTCEYICKLTLFVNTTKLSFVLCVESCSVDITCRQNIFAIPHMINIF